MFRGRAGKAHTNEAVLAKIRANRKDFNDLDDLDDEPKNKYSVSEAIREFCSISSTDALPHTVHSYTKVQSGIWVCIFLVTLIVALMFILGLEKEVTTTSVFIKSNTLKFPAVTFCNLNPVRKSKQAEGGEYFDSAMDMISQRLAEKNAATVEPQPGESSAQDDAYTLYDQLVINVGGTTLSKIGHQLQSMILVCNFGGRICKVNTDFIASYNTRYGNCFSFNLGVNSTADYDSAVPGDLFGLKMVLYVEQFEYIPWLSPTAGIRVQVHERYTMPDPFSQGISIMPGVHTDIGFSMKNESRLGLTAKCDKGKNFMSKYGYKYTSQGCQSTCLQNNIVATCECADPRYPIPRGELVCSDSNRDQMMCLIELMERYNNGEITCDCHPPCHERTFNMKVNTANWPTNTSLAALETEIVGVDPYINDDVVANGVQPNLASLSVHYNSLEYEDRIEAITSPPKYYHATIGSFLAILTGISVISGIELLQLIVTVLLGVCAIAPGVI